MISLPFGSIGACCCDISVDKLGEINVKQQAPNSQLSNQPDPPVDTAVPGRQGSITLTQRGLLAPEQLACCASRPRAQSLPMPAAKQCTCSVL